MRTISILSLLSLAACGQLHPLAGYADDADTGLDTALPGDTGLEDTGPGDDTEADSGDTGADSGDTGDAGSPPELLSFTVTDAGGGVADVAFEATDPDGDLSFLRLSVDGWSTDLLIPDEIDTWNPGGVSHLSRELDDSGTCGTLSSTFEGRVFDGAGRPSDALDDTVTVSGGGSHSGQEVEPNEWRSEATPVGALSRPATLTGVASDFGDDDYLAFTPCDGGTWQFTLDWTGGDDGSLSLYLYDGLSGLSVIDDFGFAQPKQIAWHLSAGQTYYVRVSAFDAVSGWTLSAQ